MEIKILQVFYDKNGLPYKDKERTVHYPITSGTFLGASNTTQIRFYYDQLDELNESTFVAVSKLPNGKIGSKILESEYDSELQENYAVLNLSQFYTQYKGDVYFSLQGYQGGVRVEQDEDGIYQIYGTPTIQATGSIKLSIAYAPTFIGSGQTENITLQRVLAELSTKLGIRQETLHVEELPTVGNPNVWYVINDDPNDTTKANIYIWNATTQTYVWVGDNTLDLGNYYTQEQGETFEEDVNQRLEQQDEQISSLGQLQPSGVDTSTNILAFTENKGIYIGSDTGYWYYWNGTQYVSSGQQFVNAPFDNELNENSTNAVQNKVLSVSVGKEQITLSSTDFNQDGYINSSGEIVGDNSWSHTDYFSIDNEEKIAFSNIRGFNNYAVCVAFYDENKTFISSGSVVPSGEGLVDGAVLPPLTAKFVRFCTATATANIVKCVFYRNNNFLQQIEKTNNEIDVKDLFVVELKASDLDWVQGFLTSNGSLNQSSGWITSKFFEVVGNTKLSYAGLQGYNNAVACVAVYNSNFEFLSGYSLIPSDETQNLEGILDLPSNAKYVKISSPQASQSSIKISIYQKVDVEKSISKLKFYSFESMPLLLGKKIMLYGDSIFSKDYTWIKESLEKLTGAVVYNGGFSGADANALADATRLQRIIDYKPDILIIMVGGNDTGQQGSVGTFGTYGGLLEDEQEVSMPDISSPLSGTKFIESVAYISQFAMYHIAGFRHNAYLQGLCTDVGQQLSNEDDLNNITKPIVILCSPLPQQRENQSNPYSNPKNNVRKADAVREVSRYLHIPLIDFSTLSGFDMINESYPESPTDKTHNKGTYMMDGVHPNKYGYLRMAKIISRFISLFVADKDLFDII